MGSVIGLLAASALLFTEPSHDLTLQQVLKANTAAIRSIHTIRVTIENSNNSQLTGEDIISSEVLPTYSIIWCLDGERERVRMEWLRGRKPHNDDAYNGQDGWKRLSNYDPNYTPPLSESVSAPSIGEMDKTHTDGTLDGTARGHSLMGATGNTAEDYFLSHPSSKLVATPKTSKTGCYEITRIEEKHEVSGSNYDVREVRYFIDPKVGFWLRRVERGPWQKSNDPGDKSTTIIEALEFKECDNGIFWPLRVSIKTRLPGGTEGPDHLIRHTLHSINKPLKDEDFQIHFPDWLRVYDRVSGKVFIWGPDDKPRMEFASQNEYKQWYAPRAEDPFQPLPGIPPRTRWIWLTGISLAMGLLLLGLILWRRRSQLAAEKSTLSTNNTRDNTGSLP